MFIFGIVQMYLLFNIGNYYRQLRINLIKKATNTNTNTDQVNNKTQSDIVIQYFNLLSNFLILIGLLTPFWYIYLSLILIILLSDYIENKYKSTKLPIGNNRGDLIIKYINRSKVSTYLIMSIKTIVMVGVGLVYFHGYI